ncbi:MAG: 2-iminoacetate synthase ThiH [Elusimicrobiota bacterium]|nr:2-iminoacetate synthase ThiH [Elusimicrobiota bacterium]
MGFNEIMEDWKDFDFNSFFENVKENNIRKSLSARSPGVLDLLTLLSPAAAEHLEEIAQCAHRLTVRHFGKTIALYTPMYISNHCVNRCVYCGFSADNKFERKKLTPEEVRKEAEYISQTGLRHILVLTGESRGDATISYILDCVKILKSFFSSISVEIYPLTKEEYRQLIKAGVDGLTVYQEVYDKKIYGEVHPGGPKSDYIFRLNTPERAACEGMRTINIGALLGLADCRKEVFFMLLHAKYLQDKYPAVEFSVSVPRIRSHLGDYRAQYPVSDEFLLQAIAVSRIFLKRIGIVLSTREGAKLRDNLIAVGITKMSAGSTTAVGGHIVADPEGKKQFEICDLRSVGQIKEMLKKKGYQGVFKDWMAI